MALSIAGAVHDQTGDAARGQVGDALEILNLLGDIETIEEHHGRHFAAAIRRLGVHVDRRQAGGAIGDLDMLQALGRLRYLTASRRQCTPRI